MIRRVFVEDKNGHCAGALLNDLKGNLNLKKLESVRVLQRYDIEGLDDEVYGRVKNLIFCEAPVENLYETDFPMESGETAFAIEYLPGQFDQRADSAEQCVQIVAFKRPKVACARVYVLKGALSESEIAAVKNYLINSVDSREADMKMPESLERKPSPARDVQKIDGFISMQPAQIAELHKKMSLAMSVDDLEFCRKYFAETERRDPTITEIRVLDTYWSDHCRHTTFLTRLESVKIDEGKYSEAMEKSWKSYLKSREILGLDKKGKPICLMDVALIGMRRLRADGKLDDLEVSEEINAASIVVNVDIDGRPEEWLVMFKNETHNHPTEIEPFGGAATCLGGAIRDPLSGRSYVYQAMRVTGAGDPRTPFSETLPGKLPQKKIVIGAANGYSSYGNQIGLATGQVTEIYNPGYIAKRMEIGAVVAAAPRDMVVRGTPEKGDVILLVGGRTGRDGIGGTVSYVPPAHGTASPYWRRSRADDGRSGNSGLVSEKGRGGRAGGISCASVLLSWVLHPASYKKRKDGTSVPKLQCAGSGYLVRIYRLEQVGAGDGKSAAASHPCPFPSPAAGKRSSRKIHPGR